MKPDVYIKVKFKTSADGGRKTSIKRKIPEGPDFYACPLIIDSKAYDCRLYIGNQELELGKYYEIPVAFLDKNEVLPKLHVGTKISLWEGKEIADGEIIKIC